MQSFSLWTGEQKIHACLHASEGFSLLPLNFCFTPVFLRFAYCTQGTYCTSCYTSKVILSRVTVSAIGTWSARWAILACTSGTFTPSSLFCSSKLSSLVWQVMDLFFKLLVGRMHNGPIMAMLVLWAALRTLLGQVFSQKWAAFSVFFNCNGDWVVVLSGPYYDFQCTNGHAQLPSTPNLFGCTSDPNFKICDRFVGFLCAIKEG